MEYSIELERLMTLDADTIARVCRGDGLHAQITRCFDEHLELSDLADESLTAGDAEQHVYYLQEAAAWRATADVLRQLAAESTPQGRRASA